jgi:hypothetical protein
MLSGNGKRVVIKAVDLLPARPTSETLRLQQ